MTLIAVIILLVLVLRANARINNLELQVKALEERGVTIKTPAPHTVPGVAPQVASAVAGPAPAVSAQTVSAVPTEAPVTEPQAIDRFFAWLQEDPFVKLGGLLILLALGWFVSYAFANNWIGEGGRIMLGLFIGALFLGAGIWRMRVSVAQGSTFTVIGATTVLLTVFAARHLYDIFTPVFALGLMFMTVVFVSFVSVRYDRQSLALGGLLMGAVAPFLTAATSPDMFGVLTYYLMLVLGTLWVVYVTGWTTLTPAALIVVSAITVPEMLSSSTDAVAIVVFGFVFTTVFFLANLVSTVRRTDAKHRPGHLLTASLTALYLIILILEMLPEHMQSLLLVAWSLVFGVGSYVVYRFTNYHPAFYIYGGAALALIGVATAAELSGPALTIAYIMQVGIILWTSGRLGVPDQIMMKLSALYLIPILLSVESLMSDSWQTGAFHSDFVVLLLLAISLAAAGLALLERYYRAGGSFEDLFNLAVCGLVMAGLYATVTVWLVTHALFEYDIASFISLVLYTVVGLIIYIAGTQADKQYVRLIGGAVLALVVLRLLSVEVWDMELMSRVVTFVIVGVLLLSTALISRKH